MNPLEIGIEASRTLHAVVGGEATPLKNMKVILDPYLKYGRKS